MPLPPRQEFASSADLPDVNEEVTAAREALLRFASAEGVLESLLEAAPGGEVLYPDLETVRRHATIDELLHLVARIPESDEERQGYEATALYASLLQLAEAFDILIDQYSLVYGDAVALAEAMQNGWHALAGCRQEDPEPGAGPGPRDRLQQNLAGVEPLLARVERLTPDERRKVVDSFREVGEEPWTAEARRLALHSLDACLPTGADAAALLGATEPARRWPAALKSASSPRLFELALADLILARVTDTVAHPIVSQALARPFAEIMRGA